MNIRSGMLLVGIGAAVGVIGYLATDNLYFFGGAVLWGALFLYAGLHQRRIRHKLFRQSGETDSSHFW